jgi:methyltransferase-like protein
VTNRNIWSQSQDLNNQNNVTSLQDSKIKTISAGEGNSLIVKTRAEGPSDPIAITET